MGSGTSIGIKRAATSEPVDAERADWHRRASRLYEELRRPAAALIRRAYGQTFGDAEMDDIYSSAWLGTLRALERRQASLADDEVRSYLLAAVANHASKELRRRKRKPVAPIESAGSVASAGPTPEDSASQRETARVTRDVLASLPPRRRAVMLLRYGWGLDPREVCGMVKGLTPRAYRKEITKGVEEVAAKIRLVEEGKWCAEREPLLKTYAAGLANDEQVLQAEHHLSHCRQCHEFVGKLTGHLHDLGSAVLVPGALEAVDSHAGLLERLTGAADRIRDAAAGAVSRSDPAEAVSTVTAARGAGAAGAGVTAKLAGLGAAGKAAVACLGGGVAATACVVAGVGPVAIDGAEGDAEPKAAVEQHDEAPVDPPRDPSVPEAPSPAPSGTDGGSGNAPEDETEEPAPSSEPPVAPEAPPVQQEFGVEAAAAPAPSASAPAADGGGGGGDSAVQQEFGP
jgi:RNA polymerase sigma factor (sigma-70 family)